MPDSNEQWLLDGICQECRRKDYCSKPCKHNKERIEQDIMAYIHERTGMGVLDEIREEIMDTGAYEQEINGKTEFLRGINYCLGIIEKHKTESED